MKLDEFTFSLVILAFPGIITFLVLKKVAPQQTSSGFQAFLQIFVYSILSYVVYALVEVLLMGIQSANKDGTILTKLLQNRASIGFKEIMGATVAAFVLSIGLCYCLTYNLLNRFARKIAATKRSGDKDLWIYYHNLNNKFKGAGWVFVRDHEKDLIYHGAVIGWSEEGENKELLLADVTVYSDEGDQVVNELYESELIYLNKKPEFISIEVPTIEGDDNE